MLNAHRRGNILFSKWLSQQEKLATLTLHIFFKGKRTFISSVIHSKGPFIRCIFVVIFTMIRVVDFSRFQIPPINELRILEMLTKNNNQKQLFTISSRCNICSFCFDVQSFKKAANPPNKHFANLNLSCYWIALRINAKIRLWKTGNDTEHALKADSRKGING